MACIDGLSGFAEAIHAAYPGTNVQLCIVHLVRAALRYVSTQDAKAVTADLKKIYQAATVVEAEQALEDFAQAWDAKYPTIAKMWRAKWTDIITLFDFPPPIRRAIYTTNAIESVNSVIRKFTHDLAIPLPAYPSHTYVFDCPSQKAKVYLTGIPSGARATLSSVPKDCLEAREHKS